VSSRGRHARFSRDWGSDVCSAGVVLRLDKVAGSDFGQPKAGPEGAGQDARSNMMCVVPSRYGVFSAQRTSPPSVSDSRSVATGGLATGKYTDAAAFATRAARQPYAHYQVLAIAACCNMLAENFGSARTIYEALNAVQPASSNSD